MIKKKNTPFLFSALFLFVICSKVAAFSPEDSVSLRQSGPDNPIKNDDCPDFGSQNRAQLAVGIRAGLCGLFDHKCIGYGYGLDVRLRVAKHWNVEAYYDYFKTNIMSLGYRHDQSYGIEVHYYWIKRPMQNHKFTPYIMGGFSFDDNKVYSYEVYTYQDVYDGNSPWFNLGLGSHYNITPRLDVSLETFYALPLETHPISYLVPNSEPEYMVVQTKPGFNPGGIFLILSLNYELFK